MPINKFEIYGVIALLLALAMGAAYYKGHSAGFDEEKQVYDTFVAKVDAAGEKAKADALQKEKDDAAKVTIALNDRDTALQRMRAAQAAASAARRSVPLTPAAAAGSSQLCFDAKALSAAVEQYRGSVRGLAEIGDETALDAGTLIKAWPSAPAVAK